MKNELMEFILEVDFLSTADGAEKWQVVREKAKEIAKRQLADAQARDVQYFDKFDPKSKELHQNIHDITMIHGWRGFILALFEYQSKLVNSAYKLGKDGWN